MRATLLFGSAAELTAELHDAAVIGIDIPIGLPTARTRRADVEARAFVGPRSSTVFNAPHRDVLQAPSYAAARKLSLTTYGIGVSSQAYRGLRSKILEVDALVRTDSRLFEIHPEVSFRFMAGQPLPHSKKSWNGLMLRRRLLRSVGIEVGDELGRAGGVAPDDVLDAAAVAWSALRIATGAAGSFPDPPDQDEFGRPMAIWY